MNILDPKTQVPQDKNLLYSGSDSSIEDVIVPLFFGAFLITLIIMVPKNIYSIILILGLTLFFIFLIISKRKVSFYTTYILYAYPLNRWKKSIRIDVKEIKEVRFRKPIGKQTSYAIIFITPQGKKYGYRSIDSVLLERLYKAYTGQNPTDGSSAPVDKKFLE